MIAIVTRPLNPPGGKRMAGSFLPIGGGFLLICKEPMVELPFLCSLLFGFALKRYIPDRNI